MTRPADMSDAARLSQRVHFERDGTVSVASGKVELGQGINTALAQIAAEELDVALSRIRIVPPSTAYSPDEGVTSGSLSIQDGGKGLRLACTQVRKLVLDEAARRLGTAELTVEDGIIRGNGRQTSYWELAPRLEGHEIPAEAPAKPASAYRTVGTSAARLDLPAKIAGKPAYVHDMALPDMLFARIVRPPYAFKKLVSLPEAPKGVTVVRDGSFVGVLAEREEAAVAAAAKLRAAAVWERGKPVPEDYHAWLRQNVAQREIAKEQADAAAKARGVKRLSASYTKPAISHASIGPSCALARFKDGKLEVWTHSQGIFGLRQELALVLRMDERDIVVTHADGAGCYGHNGADDVALDAALLARAAGGRPVKLQWMREDEFSWEPYGIGMAMELEAQLDAAGRIVSWRHELWSNGHSHRPGRSQLPTLVAATHLAQPFEAAAAMNPALPAGGAHRNAIPLYEFPDLLVVNHYVREMPVRSSSLRSLGGFANVFAIESFMDELAAAAGIEGVQFRLNHLKDERGRKVIEKAVEASGWRNWKKREGRGHGIAFARYKNLGAYCAAVAEVEAGRELRVTRLVLAADVGLVVNPDGVANQVEGGAIQAASWTLKEAVKPGATLGWEDYPILKFSEVPAVEVCLIDSAERSVGAGECAQGPVAAAIANALCDALGVRVRDLPLTPERIVAAIA
ncbi:MAG TPA: molybdopterin cofactor-binding domain-containing protein [Burkholderiales bacterium]|nr:molybdopterin cofactor-binding domain-containing protein [Burkholderiales bacterium]